MKKETLIRAWRDEEFRASLSDAELAELAEHPVGLLDVDDDVLRSVSAGGGRSGGSVRTRPGTCGWSEWCSPDAEPSAAADRGRMFAFRGV